MKTRAFPFFRSFFATAKMGTSSAAGTWLPCQQVPLCIRTTHVAMGRRFCATVRGRTVRAGARVERASE